MQLLPGLAFQLRVNIPLRGNRRLMGLSSEQSEAGRHEKELAEAIVGYLREHPHAMDTLAGIAEWWIMRQRIRVDVETLGRALQRLTDQGVLEKVGFGESARYRLRDDRV